MSAKGNQLFTRQELTRNLLGCLEAALFMRPVRERFGATHEEATRSFIIPILMLPVSMLALYFYPFAHLDHNAANQLAFLYCLRGAISWALFFSSVYWLTREVDRRQYFWQFVTATNWLSIPATLVFLPIVLKVAYGGQSLAMLHPAIMLTMLYTYAFTAYTAARVLRAPLELGGFIALIAFIVNNYTTGLLHLITHV